MVSPKAEDAAAVRGAEGVLAAARAGAVRAVHQPALESITDLVPLPKNPVDDRIRDWVGHQTNLADDLPKVWNGHEPTISGAQIRSCTTIQTCPTFCVPTQTICGVVIKRPCLRILT